MSSYMKRRAIYMENGSNLNVCLRYYKLSIWEWQPWENVLHKSAARKVVVTDVTPRLWVCVYPNGLQWVL